MIRNDSTCIIYVINSKCVFVSYHCEYVPLNNWSMYYCFPSTTQWDIFYVYNWIGYVCVDPLEGWVNVCYI